MDGRVQEPVAAWVKANHSVDFVDTVTVAGPDKVLAEARPTRSGRWRRRLGQQVAEEIRSRVAISVEAHGSKVVAVAGHDDCAGNPVSEEEHRRHILRAVDTVRSWGLGVTVVGLWVNADWQVEVVSR
jgi:hypothetical protein